MASEKRARAAAGLLISAIVALIFASPVLAAVAEFAQVSARGALSLTESAPSSFGWPALTASVFPGVFGIGGWERSVWMPNDLTENWLYVGAGTMLLLALGATRRMNALWMTTLLLVAFFAAFSRGVNSALYS